MRGLQTSPFANIPDSNSNPNNKSSPFESLEKYPDADTAAAAAADAATTRSSITEVAATDDSLSTLLELAQFADMDSLLNGDIPMTLFAPTNKAFSEVLQDPQNIETTLVKATVFELLSYHIVPGIYKVEQLKPGMLLTTLQGETIELGEETVKTDNDLALTVNEQTINSFDIPASNGIIHKINGVLFPKSFINVESTAKSNAKQYPNQDTTIANNGYYYEDDDDTYTHTNHNPQATSEFDDMKYSDDDGVKDMKYTDDDSEPPTPKQESYPSGPSFPNDTKMSYWHTTQARWINGRVIGFVDGEYLVQWENDGYKHELESFSSHFSGDRLQLEKMERDALRETDDPPTNVYDSDDLWEIGTPVARIRTDNGLYVTGKIVRYRNGEYKVEFSDGDVMWYDDFSEVLNMVIQAENPPKRGWMFYVGIIVLALFLLVGICILTYALRRACNRCCQQDDKDEGLSEELYNSKNLEDDSEFDDASPRDITDTDIFDLILNVDDDDDEYLSRSERDIFNPLPSIS